MNNEFKKPFHVQKVWFFALSIDLDGCNFCAQHLSVRTLYVGLNLMSSKNLLVSYGTKPDSVPYVHWHLTPSTKKTRSFLLPRQSHLRNAFWWDWATQEIERYCASSLEKKLWISEPLSDRRNEQSPWPMSAVCQLSDSAGSLFFDGQMTPWVPKSQRPFGAHAFPVEKLWEQK